MATNMTPHWGLIVFITIVYVISFLMHLDTNIVNAGGAPNAIPAIGAINIAAFLVVMGTSIGLAGVANIIAGNWAGGAAFFASFILGTAVTGTWTILVFLLDVVTFSNLGIPDWIQFLIAAPCVLMLTWTVLAFLSGVLGIGKEVST
jgi:hypothetical protein